jgi:hypothetical protein
MKNTLSKIIILSILFVSIGCKKEQPIEQPQFFRKEVITPSDIQTITPEEAATYHKDNDYEYEYRTGTSNNYKYNYDVSGYDQEGNSVTGNINIAGNQGAGTITNSNGEEIDIQAEWVNKGKLKATDDNGNEYKLEAE